MWLEGVHDLLVQIVTIILRYFAISITTLAPRCAPIGPATISNVPALTAQFSQYATWFARSKFNIYTLVPPLFEVAVRVRASGELYGAAEEFGHSPEIG